MQLPPRAVQFAVSTLRRSLQNPPGSLGEYCKHVVPHLGKTASHLDKQAVVRACRNRHPASANQGYHRRMVGQYAYLTIKGGEPYRDSVPAKHLAIWGD